MKYTIFAALLLTLVWGSCVEKKPEGSGLPTPQVGVAADTATATKKELPPAEIELPESLAAGESPTGGTVPPPPADTATTTQQAPVPTAPTYVQEQKTKKLELLDLGEKKKGSGKKSSDGGGSTKAPKEDPKRPAQYSAPTTVIPEKAQSTPLPVTQGTTLTAGQLNSWQSLVRNVTEKTSVPSAVVKIIPRKGANANKSCSDAAQALLFSYKYLVLHGDEVNARKWYNKYKTFSCADGSALLGTLIAADQHFAAFVTK